MSEIYEFGIGSPPFRTNVARSVLEAAYPHIIAEVVEFVRSYKHVGDSGTLAFLIEREFGGKSESL